MVFKKMKLIELSKLFNVSYGTKFDMNKMSKSETSKIAFISRSSKNNGLAAFVDKFNDTEPLEPGLITVTLGGTILASFLQEIPFYTAQNVAVLKNKEELSKEEKLFYCLCITANRYRYGAFGREANRTLADLLVPHKDEIPSWVYEYDIHSFDEANKPFDNQKTPELKPNLWSWFKLEDLFYIKKGKRLTKTHMKKGNVPFIGSIAYNNGYREFIEQEPIHSGNTITVNYNGSVAEAFYQPKPFWASDDVNVLYPKFKMNQYIALFIVSLIKLEKYRFNYGRKWHMERMKISRIKLPVREAGKPDYDFMERYIKTLPFSKKI